MDELVAVTVMRVLPRGREGARVTDMLVWVMDVVWLWGVQGMWVVHVVQVLCLAQLTCCG